VQFFGSAVEIQRFGQNQDLLQMTEIHAGAPDGIGHG
jgi:hypothetical protein